MLICLDEPQPHLVASVPTQVITKFQHSLRRSLGWLLGAVLSIFCVITSVSAQSAPQSLPVQDVIANSANSKRLLTSAIESMRNSIPRERLTKVHIKATVARASSPEAVIGDIDATYDSPYYTITHTIAGKHFVTHSVADNVVLPANSEKNVFVGDSAGTQGQSSTVPRYAAVRLDRHPGLFHS